MSLIYLWNLHKYNEIVWICLVVKTPNQINSKLHTKGFTEGNICQFRYKNYFPQFLWRCQTPRLTLPPRFKDSLGELQQNNTKQNQQKEKMHWANQEKPAPCFQGSFPSGVTKAIHSPGTSCDSTCEMVTTRGAR